MGKSVSLNRALLGATGTVAVLALGLAVGVIIEIYTAKGMTVGQALIEYFSYFTVLSNIFAAVILLVFCIKPEAKIALTQPAAIAASTVFLTSSGLFYILSLRKFWIPLSPIQVVAEVLLHDVVPILCLTCWIACSPKGTLRIIDAVIWSIFPLLYWTCIFLRGAISGVYPYPLVDVAARGYSRALTNATVHTSIILVLGLFVVAIDRWLARISIARNRSR